MIKALKHPLMLISSLLAVNWCSACSAESLYVFFPTDTRPHILQKQLSEARPDINVTVFGRYRDFSVKLRQEPPDAIMAKPSVINTIGGYTIHLNGSRKGMTWETCVLLSVETPVNTKALSGLAIGVIDILGRKGMKEYITQFISPPPKLKRVTKLEDLLPLLTFQMADAVLVGEDQVNYFKTMSRLNFVITPLPAMRVGILSLALKNGGTAGNILKAVNGFGTTENQMLTVDSWEKP